MVRRFRSDVPRFGDFQSDWVPFLYSTRSDGPALYAETNHRDTRPNGLLLKKTDWTVKQTGKQSEKCNRKWKSCIKSILI